MLDSVLRQDNGFSLIELLVVLVIIGIIAAVAMQSMSSSMEDLRYTNTEREMEQLAFSVVGNPAVVANGRRTDFGFVGDNGTFPPTLDALVYNPGGWSTWDGPYIGSGFTGDTTGPLTDQWGVPYRYDGGMELTSTGGGTTITRKIAGAVSDYLGNSYTASVRDANDSIPGASYRDSVRIAVTVPDGSGSYSTRTTRPDSAGVFTLTTLPAGVHPLRLVFTPAADTMSRLLTILPRHKSAPPDIYRFGAAHFSSGGPAECAGTGADTLLPSGIGTVDDLPASSCAAAWQCLDDRPPDGDLTFIESGGIGWQEGTYAVTSPVDTSCTITGVTVVVTARRFIKDASARVLLAAGGSLFTGPESQLTDEYETYSNRWTVNPALGAPWTWDDIFAIQAGVSLNATKSTHPARCTAVWLIVEYGN